MVAPIDAKVSLDAAGETIELAMNFRTLALAKKAGFDFFRMKPSDELDAFDLATIVRAFAAPAHPDLTEEEAFAIAVRHADQVGTAMKALAEEFATAAGADEKGKSAARPPKAQQKK
ncbi:hypothetical protein DFR49_3361 [Hephaestia caeni]|uniref:Tail assembly chaperone n=1 Tax=Hephaestia caeni TaxID=645617 RepID=A0A397NIW1_9SPHN|nr:hypothetical protein [Hephaestia caeni]RIA37476.1 hypothetical protein DFR49_3361 [Hephaestia caeni]